MKRLFSYFGFSKSEQRGFMILVLLISVVLLFSIAYTSLKKSTVPEHSIQYFEQVDPTQEEEYILSDDKMEYRPNRKDKRSYFYFDPNQLPWEDWRKLGFSDRQITVIKNFEAKGGKFYKKEDLAKIYSISSSAYTRIAPFIVIKKERLATRKTEKVQGAAIKKTGDALNPSDKRGLIDINRADTLDFKRFNGIGTILSKRIIKYRDALGGFYKIGQISEVYGVSSEVFEEMTPYLVVHSADIKKININLIDKDELSKHPYVSSKQARLLINYRDQHGDFKDFSNLNRNSVLSEDFFRKIGPYIEF